MSKKLIAVASAAALALTALVGVAPASANFTFGVTATGQISTAAGLNENAPLLINVPSQDVLRFNTEAISADSILTSSVIRLAIQASTTSAAVRVVSTGGVKILSETQWSATIKRTATGTQSLDTTTRSDSGAINVYVYTTSTATGSVTITQGGNSRVVWVKGNNTPGYKYNVNFTAPATADVSSHVLFTGTVTDVFGNPVPGIVGVTATGDATNIAATAFGVGSSGIVPGSSAANAFTESATVPGTYTFGLPTSATAGLAAYGISTSSTAPVKPANLPAPNWTQLITVNTASAATQIAALTAQIAALTAQLNATVTKAKYNKLVRKWNRANPNNKVKRVS
jgi:hypothetical protein